MAYTPGLLVAWVCMSTHNSGREGFNARGVEPEAGGVGLATGGDEDDVRLEELGVAGGGLDGELDAWMPPSPPVTFFSILKSNPAS